MDQGHRNFDGQRHRRFYKLRDDGMVPLICPTCQNVFAGKASMPATPRYFAWGCFRYFSWERARVGRFTLTRHLARARRVKVNPPYEAGQFKNWRKGCPVNSIENTHVYSVLAIKATVSTTAF
jgi:hypothetical protein